MKRRTSAPANQAEQQQDDEDRTATRRALLTRGGVVAAGVVGAGVAGAAVAGRANAAAGDNVVLGSLTNDAGSAATEITTANNTSETLVLTNTGSPAAGVASPPLRLRPAASGLVNPPSSTTVGGDVVATNDGFLYFTHDFSSFQPGLIFAADVHTDATANSFAPLSVPHRIIDTRSSGGRAHVINPSGAFDSTGRLLKGHTILVDLTSLVSFGDAVTANLTVINPAASGYLTLWSGGVARPTAASIAFSKAQTISNLAVSALAEITFNGHTFTDVIAIFASATTFVILDVAGFTVADLGQVLVSTFAGTETRSRAARIQAARAAIAKRATGTT
jgi:hypothetical protein